MTSKDSKYAIFIKNSLLKELSKVPTSRTVLLGQIVKVEGTLASGIVNVRFLKEGETWEAATFCSQKENIVSIPEKLWPYISSISSPQERVKLSKNTELCNKLKLLSKDVTVGFTDTSNVCLGKIRYMGIVKGMGFCFGIELHEKRKYNTCDGSCAGIQYFKCTPGHGVFTTIDSIIPAFLPTSQPYEDPSPPVTDLDRCLQKNINSMLNGPITSAEKPSSMLSSHKPINMVNNKPGSIVSNNGTLEKPKYEKIVTKYGEYSRGSATSSSKNSTNGTPSGGYFRNSLSLQNILDTNGSTVNTNNDFDQNTMIQPEKTQLMNDSKVKNKSEMDLKEILGNTWNNVTESAKPSENSMFIVNPKKNLDKNDNVKEKYTVIPENYSSILPSQTYNDSNITVNSTAVSNNVTGSSYTMNNNRASSSSRNKSMNPLSHLLEANNTLRRSKFYTDYIEDNGVEDSGGSSVKVGKSGKKMENGKGTKSASTFYVNSGEKNKYHEPQPGTTNDLVIGSLVEVQNDVSKDPLYGVVRWMGVENGSNFILVGVELEEEQSHLPLILTDGTHNGDRFFSCGDNRALFVPLQQCHKDSRFQDGVPTPVHQVMPTEIGECPVIPGELPPLCMPTEEDVEAVCGKFRGIQGHHNSCYLDVTLFSMFTYTAVFDSLLFRPKTADDIDDYDEVQRVLREEIVNPLRKNLFVSAEHVMKLRRLLDRLSSVSGLTSEEKDPEEFLNSLLAQILRAEPFLQLSSGQEAFYYQLFVEKDKDLTLPTVQQLFEQSFLTSNIKLKEVPSCLIIQMPRFGKNYKMYQRILPSQLLDVTDIIEGSPRQCTVCGKLAKWECRECFDDCSNSGLESTAFCTECFKIAHRHEKRQHHKPTKLEVADDFSIMEDHCRPPRLYMELFAVICIETSHYVTFVKCGVGHEAPWCFFDSMADRKGEKHGYNIPEMVACPDISRWLSDEQLCKQLNEEFPSDRHLPEHARRLLCDAYICMYQSSDVMMYR